MTSKSTATLLCLGLGFGSVACDPARTGYYHGNYPAPVHIEMPGDVASDLGSGFGMTLLYHRDVRRWGKASGTTYVGGNDTLHGLWSSLAHSLDWSARFDALENYNGPRIVVGSILGVPDYVYMVAGGYAYVQPTGPSGPTLTVTPGFHAFHRSCTADNPNHFDEVALDTKLVYDPTAAANQLGGIDPYLENCGIRPAPAFDLGTKVGSLLPLDAYGEPLAVTDLAWAPASDVVYLLTGTLTDHNVEILSYSIGATHLAHVAMGDYRAPLEVANGGTSLLVNRAQAVWDNYSGSYYVELAERLRLSLLASDVPAQIRLPFGTRVSLETTPMGLLSPDGNTLAITTSDSNGTVTALVDVKSGGISNVTLPSVVPLAWDPTGRQLLVELSNGTAGLQIVSLDGSPPVDLPSRGDALRILPVFVPDLYARHRVFWTASGPKAVMQGGMMERLPVGTAEEDRGVKVHDVVTGKSTLFVEPTRQAPPIAPLGVVVATEQVFAWAIECLGLGETSCTSELRRLSLATGAVDVVARADAALPFAVSPDGAKLVFAHKDGIYLKTIKP